MENNFMNWPLIPTAFAQATIHISSAIPGLNSNGANAAPGAFVANFYQFALLIGGILAFGAIVYGGVLHAISAGNPSRQSEGKKWIGGALLGLLLLAGAYIILNTINPNLLNLNLPTLSPLNIPAVTTLGSGQICDVGPSGGLTCSSSGGFSQATVQSLFAGAGITTHSTGPPPNCNDQNNPNCTSLQGMQPTTVSELMRLKSDCNCAVTVTGGTEVGHAAGEVSHLNGDKADINPNSAVSAFIQDQSKSGFVQIANRTSDGAAQYKDPLSGAVYAREGNHWDISVPTGR
jgi:hypothetical protein